MPRITVAVTEEQEEFIKSQRRKYGNQSGVIRYALDELKKRRMIQEVQEHFRRENCADRADKCADRADKDQAKATQRAWKDVPEY